MSSFKESEIQAVSSASTSQNAAQAIAQIDNPQTCVKTVPILDMESKDAYWVRLAQYERYCGGRNKATKARILTQLLFRYQVKPDGTPKLKTLRHGSYWWARTKDQWASECHMTYDEARRAIEGLERDGIIETRDMKSRASLGVKTLHMRWTGAEGAAALNGYPVLLWASHKALKPVENNSHEASTPDDQKASTPDVCIKGVDLKGMNLKPVDATPTATQPTPAPEMAMQLGMNQDKAKSTPDAVVKPRKFSKLGKTWDETLAKNYPTNIQPPKGQRERAYSNLSRVKDRMIKEGYDYPAVTRFVEFMAGDGWGIVRAQWNPEFNPQIGQKEKAPQRPDLAWLVGSAEHGTGMHRLEIALDCWHMEGEPRPDQSAQQDQEYAAWLAEHEASKAAQQQAIALANAGIEAAKAAKAAVAPTQAKEGKSVNKYQKQLAAEMAAKAPSVPATPTEPVVSHFLAADDYEPCDEPPLSSEKCGFSTDELRAMDAAKERAKAAAKAARTGANMFKHGKPKGGKASHAAT